MCEVAYETRVMFDNNWDRSKISVCTSERFVKKFRQKLQRREVWMNGEVSEPGLGGAPRSSRNWFVIRPHMVSRWVASPLLRPSPPPHTHVSLSLSRRLHLPVPLRAREIRDNTHASNLIRRARQERRAPYTNNVAARKYLFVRG